VVIQTWRVLLNITVILACCTSNVAGMTGARQDTAGVSFDFQNVDIRAVITAMAEAGGFNVAFGSIQSRTITLKTSQPIPRTSVRGLLESIMRSNGLTITEEAGVLRVSEPTAAPVQQIEQPVQQRPVDEQQDDPLLFYVYRLRHTEAPRLASTLQALFGAAVTGSGLGSIREPLSEQLRRQRIQPGLAQPEAPAREQPGGSLGSGEVGQLYIVADESSNSLLIRARALDWATLRQAIDTLDVRPLQVLIEALIIEARRSASENIDVSTSIPLTFEPRSGAEMGGQIGQSATGDATLRVLGLGAISADIVITALSSKANVRVLSRPIVMAQNNYEARILIGSQRPFVQVVRALPTESAVRDQVVQYREVGTSLSIRPTISPDGYVTLAIVQEVSNATAETQFGAPVISSREASTRLLVRDGQTAVIGGLIDHVDEDIRSGVPILKDIPVLGWLFGSTQKTSVQSELFLLLTPHVVRSDEEAERLRRDLEQTTDIIRRNPPQLRIIRPDTTRRGGG
jgi:general secretion pathway protein D